MIFFDAGHTLVYPARPVGQVYADIAAHYGVRADAAQLEQGFRQAWKAGKNGNGGEGGKGTHRPGSRQWWFDCVKASWQTVSLPSSFPFNDYFEEVFRSFAHPALWRVYPDVWPCLETLREQGHRMGVLSNWDHRLRPVLRGHGLDAYFSVFAISEEIGHAKPTLPIFRAAEEMAGENQGLTLVGDDPELDGKGARQAGWSFSRVHRPETDLVDILNLLLELQQEN